MLEGGAALAGQQQREGEELRVEGGAIDGPAVGGDEEVEVVLPEEPPCPEEVPDLLDKAVGQAVERPQHEPEVSRAVVALQELSAPHPAEVDS